MKTLSFLSVLSGLLFAHSSVALIMGGMSGGGGEIIDDMHNPWFAENTKVVTYCIKVDTTSVSADLATITKIVNSSIAQWTQIFTEFQSSHPETPLKLATQTWVPLDCSQPVDVAFQFGWGTLSAQQIQDLSQDNDPHKYIAVTWRNSYDLVQLKGTGYVYFGSDFGPNAFTPGPDQIDRPWQYGGLLQLEALHELGHVFGLPHLSSKIIQLSPRWVMSEYFPEVVLGQWIWQGNPPGPDDPAVNGPTPFFDPTIFQITVNTTDTNYASEKAVVDWFGFSPQTASIGFQLSFQNSQVSSFSAQASDANKAPLGSPITITIDSSFTVSMPDIELYLNPQQTVFPPPQYSYLPYQAGAGARAGNLTGHFTSTNGKNVSFLAILTDGSVKMIVTDPTTGNPKILWDTNPLTTD